jgi:hypothetical protein
MKVFCWFYSLIFVLCGSMISVAQEAPDCSLITDPP